MLPPIPALADYGISPSHGFLPDERPLTHLPDPYYNKWESVVGNLQALILTRRLRGVIDSMPVLSTAGLEHVAEWRRAYSLLSFMAHAYIWGGDHPSDRLPPPISIPLLQIAHHLELPPVATYAALCLWNWKPLFMDEDIERLDNLATLNTFTGSTDESWFYLISVAIEARGAPIVPMMIKGIQAARGDDPATLTNCLRAFAERLTDLTNILQRMHENCEPTVFYNAVRPFLAGSKNMADAGLPDGVLYDTGSADDDYRQYNGGSNAQSSLIQFFDVVLGVQHRPTRERRDSGAGATDPPEQQHAAEKKHNFLLEMRKYMPGPHARFLEDVSRAANIRPYVEAHRDNHELCLAYDACLAMLSAFRDKHIAIVTRYIINPSRRVIARSRSRSPAAARRRMDLAAASRKTQAHKQTGTGGTALIPFLKQARDETGEPAIEEWTKQFMRKIIKPEDGSHEFFASKSADEKPAEETEDVEVKGLAASWTMEDDIGGICSF
ncbi:Indoleamine 2 [Escovopsis weberi]|uniref:Indoleamine 2 n=1 Tax=Escovopsis weberi TaxID=150374 RepID=A0A0M8MZ86_ESCWE|nr:Indoleamine 2 [Escovopsis weberi]